MSGKTSLGSATSISLADPNLWVKFQASSSSKGVGFFKIKLPSGGPLYIISMSQSIKMIPFVRTAAELFETTAKRVSIRNNFAVVVNGPTYGLTASGKVDALVGSDPVSASETLQQGRIIRIRQASNKNETTITGVGFSY